MITPFRIVVLFFSICLSAVLIIPELRIDLIPNEQAPVLQVNYSYASASPEIVEQDVTAPLENIFSRILQLKKIESQSSYHQGTIQLTFDKHTNMNMKKFEIAAMVRQVYPQLPTGITYPEVIQSTRKEIKEKGPLLVYTITGPATGYEIKMKSEELLRKPIAQLSGVSDILVTGTENMQLSIVFDQDKLNHYRVSPGQLLETIAANAKIQYPGATKDKNDKELFVKIQGNALTIASIQNLAVRSSGTTLVKIKDVANVFLEAAPARQFFRINSQNAINFSVYVQEGENAILLRNKIQTTLHEAVTHLPQGYQVRMEYDATEFLEKELNKNYLRTSLSVSILFLFILISYRNWKYLIILFSALIVNVAFTIILTWYLHINIHLYTLAGIAISFGVMIDNAIVMLDYYHQFKNRKVFLALLGATLTTITALLLVFLLPEEDRNNLTDFVSIIAIALGTSLLSSLLFIPGMYQLINTISPDEVPEKVFKLKIWKLRIFLFYEKLIAFLRHFRKSFLALLILAFGLPVFLLPAKWEDHGWYNRTIGSELYQENIRPFIDKALGGSLRLFVRNVYEKSSYRNAERTRLFVTAELAYGNTPDQMNYIIGRIEEYLRTIKSIDKYVTNVYSGQYARIEISFLPEYENGSLPYGLKSRLIARSLDWGGVSWNVFGVGQGFSNRAQDEIPSYQVLMKGYNYDELEHQASLLAKKLLTHKRVQKVNIDERLSFGEKSSQEYVLEIDQKKLALQQANIFNVVGKLKEISKPQSSFLIAINNTFFPLVVREKHAGEFSTWELIHSPFHPDSLKALTLSGVANLELHKTSSAIHKENRQYIRLVGFEYYGSWQIGDRFLKKQLEAMKAQMPVGYTAIQQSWSWNFEKTKRQYSLILLLIAANFIICAILFENLTQPLLIIVTLPVSFIGLFLIFALFDFYFDQGGYAAFVLLGGLVVNAAILIINDYNNNCVPCRSENRRLLKTITNRARTILLTVLSTCFGMIPFLIEGQDEVFWFSLAIGTTGGIVMSLVAVFVVLPVLMVQLPDKLANDSSTDMPLN